MYHGNYVNVHHISATTLRDSHAGRRQLFAIRFLRIVSLTAVWLLISTNILTGVNRQQHIVMIALMQMSMATAAPFSPTASPSCGSS